jgi:cell division protease FtsH
MPLRKTLGQQGKPMDRKIHINFWYVTGAILLMLGIQSLYLASTKSTPIPYSRFQTLLNEDKVAEIGITQNSIRGTLKEAQPDGLKDFVTTRVDPELAQGLDKHGVVYTGVIESTWLATFCPGSSRGSSLSRSGCL